MKNLMLVFLLSSSIAVAQSLTPDDREMIANAIMAGDTNVFLRLADKCPPDDNQYWDLQFFKAAMFCETQQYSQAIELFSIVKDAAPAYAIRSYQGISVAKDKLGDKTGADSALKTSKELADEGTRMMRAGNDKGAIKYYSDYLAANPTCSNAVVYASLANLLEAHAQAHEALAICEKWVETMPECPAAFRQRGGVKWKLGDKAGAQADFDKVKRLGGRVDAKGPTDETLAY